MNTALQKRHWPNKYPAMRVLVAFIVVPLLSNLMLVAVNRLWVLTHSPPFEKAGPPLISYWILLAIIYSVPGYVTFLLLGVPSLYLLYRMDWSGFVLFAVLGACYTFLPWVVLGFGVHSHATAVRMQVIYLWEEFKAVGVVGATNGILTRFIILGRR